MGKESEIWKEIKPKIGEMLMAVNNIETQAEKAQEEAYQRGLSDAWEAAKKIWEYDLTTLREIFGEGIMRMDFFMKFTASEVIEEIRAYEQAQKEKEDQTQKEEEKPFSVDEFMRQYLDKFCKSQRCRYCVLNTDDFTCGRGYYFTTADSPVSDEEVRRAYAEVMKK